METGEASMSTTAVERTLVDGVRRFNRFYTSVIGALDEGHLQSAFTLAEVRLLFELAHREQPTASTLARELAMDAGQLSRVLDRLVARRLVTRTRSGTDGRVQHLALTRSGRTAFASLDARAHERVASMLSPLQADDRRRLIDAMGQVRALLGGRTEHEESGAPYLLRTHQAGDVGWIIQRHGVLFAQEYGWDARFEGLVARIVADFLERFDARYDRCWIAERDGANVGSVLVTRLAERPGVARLRLLLVEPSARGLGIGRRLVDECTRFARSAGYHTITLWTNDVLTAARHIYASAGYRLVASEEHDSFGKPLVAETWELGL